MRTSFIVLLLSTSLLAKHSGNQSRPSGGSTWSTRFDSACVAQHPSSYTGALWAILLPSDQIAPDGFPCSIGYLTVGSNGLALSNTIVMTARTDVVSGTPTYNYNLDGSNSGSAPANARIYIERKLPRNCGSVYDASCPSIRWWYDADTVYLGEGNYTVTASLSSLNNWSNANGTPANTIPVDFQDAVSNTGQIGITFGGGWFFGHGINVSNGSANFVMVDYHVQ